ncbi:acetylornithine deacetylase [Amorphus sp. MBR-141]
MTVRSPAATTNSRAAEADGAPQAVRTVSILRNLIAFPTVSAQSNLDIVDHIAGLLEAEGVAARRIFNAAGDKASILATIGPADRPGIALSAHTDVVPVDGQAWSSDPFRADVRDGRIYGRGATDMKGFVAAVLAHVPLFKASASATPVHICLSYDEELGCLGAPDLVAATAALPVPPALCIVGEPTGLRVARSHKGKLAQRLTFTGRGGHSALPHLAANAVQSAADLAAALSALGRELRAITDDAFTPPWTSIHVGSIHGGGALNFVPDHAVMEFEARILPGTDVAGLDARLEDLIAQARSALAANTEGTGIAVDRLSRYPGLDTPADSPAVQLVSELCGTAETPVTLSFGTEAGLYSAAGIATVVCGPGDIARAHKADEWIGLDELADAGAMLTRLAARLADPLPAN